MRITIYLLGLSIILLIGFNANAKGAPVQTSVRHLDSLMMISQDLEEDSKIYISVSKKEEKSCFCVCRYPSWVCTNGDSCKVHNDECQNSDG